MHDMVVYGWASDLVCHSPLSDLGGCIELSFAFAFTIASAAASDTSSNEVAMRPLTDGFSRDARWGLGSVVSVNSIWSLPLDSADLLFQWVLEVS